MSYHTGQARQNGMLPKSNLRAGSKYGTNKLMQSSNIEAKELWEVNKELNSLHPLSANSKTIAGNIAASEIMAHESVPAATFRNGRFPHRYTTVDFDADRHEPEQNTAQSNISPLQFASMKNMMHLLPPGIEKRQSFKPTTFSEGLDTRVTGKFRWKTSDNSRTKLPPYQSNYKTSTNIKLPGIARSRLEKNRMIAFSDRGSARRHRQNWRNRQQPVWEPVMNKK